MKLLCSALTTLVGVAIIVAAQSELVESEVMAIFLACVGGGVTGSGLWWVVFGGHGRD